MDAARARGFRPANELEIVEGCPHDVSHLAKLIPRNPRNRIEIYPQLVGMVEVVGANRMRVQLETGEVSHPDEGGSVARHHLFCRPTRWKRQRDHLDPWWSRLRRALLKEEIALDAVRIAHEDVGSAARALQRSWRDGDVIARQIELCVAGLRKQHLVRIRDRDPATRNSETLLIGGARHPVTITKLGPSYSVRIVMAGSMLAARKAGRRLPLTTMLNARMPALA